MIGDVIIIADAAVLTTLAAADALDALLRYGLPIEIPDAVHTDLALSAPRADAHRFVRWCQAHLDLVRFAPTMVGVDQRHGLEEGRSIAGMGEYAALEVFDRFFEQHPDGHVLVLTERPGRWARAGPRETIIRVADVLGMDGDEPAES